MPKNDKVIKGVTWAKLVDMPYLFLWRLIPDNRDSDVHTSKEDGSDRIPGFPYTAVSTLGAIN